MGWRCPNRQASLTSKREAGSPKHWQEIANKSRTAATSVGKCGRKRRGSPESGREGRTEPGLQFPEIREINREFLEISHDSGLLTWFWEPVAKRIQWVAGDSLLLRKQGMFFARTGNSTSWNREIAGPGSIKQSGIRSAPRHRPWVTGCETLVIDGGCKIGIISKRPIR